MLDKLEISSPKRNRRLQNGWEGFFPYYAGYPEIFASNIIKSAGLPPRSIILDPWNGSGTTLYAARKHGHFGLGIDINPVMIVVARARMLFPSEADCLEPLGRKIIGLSEEKPELRSGEPLLSWFQTGTAQCMRGIERAISESLVGRFTISERGADLDRLSSIASAFYIALFAVCRELASPFQSSNPTWLRKAKSTEECVSASPELIREKFLDNVASMATALAERVWDGSLDYSFAQVKLADSVSFAVGEEAIDFILTSPPYCTRIDYATATQVELAVLDGLMQASILDLGRKMIGSTRVPTARIEVGERWGSTCREFLAKVETHSSKASSGYYLKTHLDYFEKMDMSLSRVSRALKKSGVAVLVVQDSFYKEVHNDLPAIITELAGNYGLSIERREDFPNRRSMATVHPQFKDYVGKEATVEAVLCFEKRR